MESTPANKWVYPFGAALFAMLCLQMSNLGFSPLLPEIKKEFNLSGSQIGFFIGIYGVFAILLSLPAGLAIKRFGEKTMLIIGTVGVIVGLQLLAQSENYTTALVGRSIWISGYRFAFICILTAIALTAPASLKGRSMGLVGAVSSLASVIGSPLAGYLAKSFGWRMGFMGYIITDILGLLVVIFLYKRHSHGEVGEMHSLGEKSEGTVPNAFKMPMVWAMAFLVGMVGMAALTVTHYAPLAAKDKFDMDTVGTGWIISTGYLAAIFVNLLVGFLMDKYNKLSIMSGIVCILIPAVFMLSTDNMTVFRVSAIITLAVGFSATNQIYGIAGELLKGKEMGNVMGVMSLVSGIFGFLAPQALGFIRDATHSFNAGWYLIVGTMTIALLELVWLKTRKQ